MSIDFKNRTQIIWEYLEPKLHLKTLDFQDKFPWMPVKCEHLSQLTSLNVRCGILQGFLKMTANCKFIVDLTLHSRDTTNIDLTQIFENNTSLTRITLINITNNSLTTSLNAISKHSRKLRYLKITEQDGGMNQKYIDYLALNNVFTNCKLLQQIHISGCYAVDKDSVIHALKVCKYLEKLHIALLDATFRESDLYWSVYKYGVNKDVKIECK
jgi:hypothetical protein